MATLNIGGRTVTVGDEFLQLSSEQQSATVDEIAKSLMGSVKKPDKYQQAAIEEQAQLKSKGIDPGAGYTRRLTHGATFGADNTLLAAAQTPLEMIKRGTFNPVEGYNYAKAREDRIMDDSRENTGILGTATEALGGVVSGAGLAKAGVTAARFLAPEASLAARAGASAADGAAIGGFSGAMEGNGLAERGENAVKGLAIGGVAGGVLPAIGSGIKFLASPITSQISARLNPKGYAESQVARAIQESGLPAKQIAQEVDNGIAAGQPMTVADALGNPGQRMLSTVTRSPGEGRTQAVEFLNNRQAGQAGRVGDIVDEALGATGTARKTTAQLTKAAQEESAPYYQKALDRKPVWNDRIQEFFDDPVAASGLKEGVAVQRLESLATGKKFNPEDFAIVGFNEAGDPIIGGVPNMRTINLIKKGWDNQLEAYRDSTTGKLALDERGRALDAVRRSFLKEIDSVNPDYAKARALYSGPAQVRDAVNTGRNAAARGRAADNIDQFEGLNAPSQQGFRQGYADTLATRIERGAEGVNAARPLTSQKAQAELDALSLHQGPVQPGQASGAAQRLARERTMFETRNQALGGSRTADNLNDDAAMAVSPEVIGVIKNVVTGNFGGALSTAIAAGRNGLTGNTAAVRKEVANILLESGRKIPASRLEAMVDETLKRALHIAKLAENAGRGATAGGLVVAPGQNRR